jgi:hypothetical protein
MLRFEGVWIELYSFKAVAGGGEGVVQLADDGGKDFDIYGVVINDENVTVRRWQPRLRDARFPAAKGLCADG